MAAPEESVKRYVGARELKARLGGVSDTSLWRWIKAGKFPRPSYFGARRAWLVADIEAWAAEQRNRPPRAA